MDNPMEKKVSRRSMLGGGLKAAAALGVGSALFPVLEQRVAAQNKPWSFVSDTKSTGKLTVAILGNAASNTVALKAFKAFQAQTGIITTPLFINVATWVDFFEQIETRLIAGVDIDTMNLATEGFRLFASKGVLAPLDAYIAQDKATIDSFYADMNQRTLSQFRQHAQIDGHTYYIPWGYNTMGIWYNRKTFKSGNVSEPSPDWTWDDFLAAVIRATKAPEDSGMNLTIDVFQGIEPWIFTNGGQVLNNAWTSCNINNPAAVEACAFARSLVAKKLAPSPGGTFNQFGSLGQGNLAMMGAGIWPWNYYVENGGGSDLAIVPWPKKVQQGSPRRPRFLPDPRRLEVEGRGLGVRQVLDLRKLPGERGRPHRRWDADANLHSQQPVLLEDTSTRGRILHRRARYATPVVGVTNASAVEGDIDTTWQQILAGSISPAAGLAHLESKANGELNVS